MPDKTYELLGFEAVEHEDDNRDLKPSEQRTQAEVVVYTTSDKDEANAICQEGGFVKDGKWTVVTGHRIAGAEPENQPIGKDQV